MAGKKKKAEITVKPVSWNAEGKVLKYQAYGEFDGIKVYGYPCINTSLALRSLRAQCDNYMNAAPRIIDAVNMNDGKVITIIKD